jgi:capsular exopolysaccharide synthesis family protein
MQFAVAVRQRLNVLIASLVVAFLLAGLYYATATRYYAAETSLLVLQTGDGMATSMVAEGTKQQSLMPTYVKLITSPAVLEGALKRLRREDCIDFAGVPKDRRAAVLERNLIARTRRQTNIIEVSYRSTDPYAAVAVVNAVKDSYLDFMDRTHKRTVREIHDLLETKAEQIQWKLNQIEAERTRARIAYKDLDLEGQNKVHPLVQEVLTFKEALTEARRKRIEMETGLEAVEKAIRNGENLHQVALSVADVVGKEILLTSLGFQGHEARVLATVQQTVIDDQGWLNHWGQHLGPRHPRVLERRAQLRENQTFLRNFDEQIQQRITELQDHKLGPLLREMLTQELARARQMERSLEGQCVRAETAAVDRIVQRDYIQHLDHQWDMQNRLYSALVDQIGKTELKHEGSDLRTTCLANPVVNPTPVLPNLKRIFLLAFFAGTTVGLGLIYMQDALDDRFRSVEEIQARLRVPVLAMVRKLSSGEASGLESIQVHASPDAPESEAFRTLRTALALSEGQTQRLVFTSAEPGDGKTTAIANLAVSFAQSGKKTLLIDADLRRPGLTAQFELRGAEGLSGIVRSDAEVAELAARHIRAVGVEGLDLLPSGPRPTNPAELLAHPRFAELLGWAESIYDQILIDSPPSLATSDTAVIGRLVDGVVLVVQPEKNRRRLVVRCVETYSLLKIPVLGVVLNRIGAEHGDGYYGYGSDYCDDEDKEDEFESEPYATAEETGVVAARVPGETDADSLPDAERSIVPRRVA